MYKYSSNIYYIFTHILTLILHRSILTSHYSSPYCVSTLLIESLNTNKFLTQKRGSEITSSRKKDSMGELKKGWKYQCGQRKCGFCDSADEDAHGIIIITSAITICDQLKSDCSEWLSHIQNECSKNHLTGSLKY